MITAVINGNIILPSGIFFFKIFFILCTRIQLSFDRHPLIGLPYLPRIPESRADPSSLLENHNVPVDLIPFLIIKSEHYGSFDHFSGGLRRYCIAGAFVKVL
jgi:hypothetical protein